LCYSGNCTRGKLKTKEMEKTIKTYFFGICIKKVVTTMLEYGSVDESYKIEFYFLGIKYKVKISEKNY